LTIKMVRMATTNNTFYKVYGAQPVITEAY